jgi:hypothetical protein
LAAAIQVDPPALVLGHIPPKAKTELLVVLDEAYANPAERKLGPSTALSVASVLNFSHVPLPMELLVSGVNCHSSPPAL